VDFSLKPFGVTREQLVAKRFNPCFGGFFSKTSSLHFGDLQVME